MLFILTIEAHGMPKPVKEYKFDPSRKWRFDYAIVEKKVAIEVEGGIFKKTIYRDKKTGQLKTHTGGRHNTGKGFLNDCIKYNTATSMGWKVLRFQPEDLYKKETIELIKKTLNL